MARSAPRDRPLLEWSLLTAVLLLLTIWFGPWLQHLTINQRIPDPTNGEGHASPVDYLNLRLYDLALGTHARLPSGRVVLVDIDDISMLQVGRWPWSRPVIAALINRIAEGHPEALAIDILFAEVSARPHNDQLLRNALQNAARQGTRIILAVGKEEGTNNYLPLYPLDLIAAGNTLGHITFHTGRDGLVRGLYMEEGHLPALSWALVDRRAQTNRNETLNMLLDRRWDVQDPLLPGALKELPPRISAAALLRGDVSPLQLQGRKVLLGSTAIGSGDFFVSPLENAEPRRISGLELHAAAAEALITRHTKQPLSGGLQGTLDIVLVLVTMLLLYRTSPAMGLIVVSVANGLLLGVSLLAFHLGWWLAPGGALTAISLGYPLWNWRRLSAASAGLLRQARSLELFGGVFGTDCPAGVSHEPISAQLNRVQVATQQVAQLNRFLSDSLQSLPHPVLVADHEQRPILRNQRYLNAFGDTGECCPTLPECFISIFGKLPADFRNEPSQLAGEYQDGKGRHWRVDVSATGANAEERRWLIQFVDLTARRLADREREETLSFLSHDLRSPQATILAIIEKLRHTTDGADRDAGLDELARQSRRALELTDGFLAYTRAEIKPIQPEDHDLNDLITEVVDLAWFSANAKKIRLGFTPGEAAVLRCDADLLRRAFSNLVENGIRHSPVDSSIELALTVEGARYIITIRDHGPGVPPDKQALIFKPFWQSAGSETTGPRSAKGSAGLGLAMVHKAIMRHGGTIRVFNHAGGGAVFEISLPQTGHNV